MGTLILNTPGGQIVLNVADAEPDPGPDPGTLDATHNFTAGWATFGQVIPRGAVPAGQAVKVGALATQCDVKTTWPDGSARFAIITCKPTTTADQALSVVTLGAGTFTPTIPTAAVVLAIDGTDWTAALTGTVSEDPWLDGPQVKEWRHVVTPVDPSSTPHPWLRVYFDTRVYADGLARVDVTVENCLDAADATRVDYDVAVTVDGEVVFTQDAVAHYYLARWRKVFGVGLIESAVTLDFEPCYAAVALPRYLDTIADATYSTEGATFAILQRGGNSYDYMPATGERAEIAPYPDWAVRLLKFQSPEKRDFVLANGDLAGSWPVHIRETDGTLVSIDDRPYFWLDPRGQLSYLPPEDIAKGNLTDATLNPLVPDLAHCPSLAYVPYLVTGDRYYADELALWGNYALVCSSYNEGYGRSGSLGIVGVEQVRARAWGLRNLVDAAAYLPDADPAKAYLSSKVANNLDYYDTYAQDHAAETLGTTFERPTTSGIGLETNQMQSNFLAWAIRHANRQGFSGGRDLEEMMAAFQLRLFTSDPDYPREYAAPYWIVVGTIEEGNVWTYFETMAEIWAASFVNPDTTVIPPDPFAGFYGIDARLSLLLAIAKGWAGAQDAYDYLMAQDGMTAFVHERAGFAIDPTYYSGE